MGPDEEGADVDGDVGPPAPVDGVRAEVAGAPVVVVVAVVEVVVRAGATAGVVTTV